MKMLKLALAAGAMIAPLLVFDAPAQAYTAQQYHAQGRGVYLNSTGSRKRYYGYGWRHRYYGHHWRRYHRYHRYY